LVHAKLMDGNNYVSIVLFIINTELVLTKKQIILALIKIHKKYSDERRSNENSQMCTLWSISNPPDVLEWTLPFDEIVDVFDYGFSEDEAVEFYDMDIREAADYIFNILQNETDGKI